ncbi:unnamed protein product [Pleuronectes platessa]|uniref:Uncharacterized protein n=1 Tax=Pleuronectes platessa TaxID=8262 RepID=A0A9N7W1A9_PLEPL|nr:unnamed protein product [Pleuronectes platessa]
MAGCKTIDQEKCREGATGGAWGVKEQGGPREPRSSGTARRQNTKLSPRGPRRCVVPTDGEENDCRAGELARIGEDGPNERERVQPEGGSTKLAPGSCRGVAQRKQEAAGSAWWLALGRCRCDLRLSTVDPDYARVNILDAERRGCLLWDKVGSSIHPKATIETCFWVIKG